MLMATQKQPIISHPSLSNPLPQKTPLCSNNNLFYLYVYLEDSYSYFSYIIPLGKDLECA